MNEKNIDEETEGLELDEKMKEDLINGFLWG